MRIKCLYILIIIFLICSCDKVDMKQSWLQGPSEWVTAKVAVVLPLSGEGSDKERYERISRMFEENVIKAQYNLSEGVKLELEWIDENTVDIRKFAEELYYRDDVMALIGPLRNENVEIVADAIYKKGMPMFVMTSSESIVRKYSSGTAGVKVKEPFLWSMSATDMVQSNIILAKAGCVGAEKLSLICPENAYGDTFYKWVPQFTGEMSLTLVDNVRYSDTRELQYEFERICKSETEAVICALNDTEEAKIVLEIANDNPEAPKIFFTGSVFNSSLFRSGALAEGAEGFSMYPSPYTGFLQAYQTRFDELPMHMEAQLYDSLLLTLISFAYHHYSGGSISMNRVLARLSDLPLTDNTELHESLFWETGTPVWDHAALRECVLEPARQGKFPEFNLIGALGNIKFAKDSYTTLSNSIYMNWMIHDGQPHILDFIDESGVKFSSYVGTWEWLKLMEDLENDTNSKYEVTLWDGNKAVLICGSEGWYNYRHQADLLYVYNTLKKNHFTDDDIILIMRDDIAYNPKNPHQGVIRVSPEGENLYQDVVIDYRADTLSTKDIEDILIGNKSERLSTVLESTDKDNVLIYWTGHGTEKSFSWMERGEKFTDVQMGQTVRKMYEDRKYMSMLIFAEPCYSGSVVKAIEGIPLVLGLSAASDDESSYAENFNSELGVWMCDRFTLNLINIYENFRYTDLLETYKKLNSSTLGSHVQIYNTAEFYNLGDCMLWNYMYNLNY